MIGITDHAQEQLGDVVYVELPKAGESFAADEWHARNALLRRRVPPKVRAYLNQSGSTTSPATVSRLTH